MKRRLSIFLLLLTVACASVKKIIYSDDQLKVQLKQHIATLASDRFEGRETGTAGEKLAYEYIIRQFKAAGLKPKGTNGYLQEFTYTSGADFGLGTQLIVNNNIYEKEKDFYPLPYSSDGSVTGFVTRVGFGITDVQLNRDDYRGKVNIAKRIFLIQSGVPDGNDPHGKWNAWTDMRKKIDLAISHGAAAIIFINSDTTQNDPTTDWKNHTTPVAIPIVFAKPNAAKVLRDSVILNCTVGVEIKRITQKGHNVVAYIDNHSDKTVAIGAHYDHLGYGDEGSLYRGARAIHNGADDNASGTSALIEIGRYLKSNDLKSNYLIIAFSGEEKGLLGSNYYVKHPTVDMKSISYMINMDMLGRLKTEEPTLIISGTGTSPKWKSTLDSLPTPGIKYKETESGVGPSDHTSFYLQNIPVLHFFSGTHPDYHKPSDDEDKINYDGELKIVRLIERMMMRLDASEKLAFSKTKDENNEDAPKFKVTLGVVPDYAYEGTGMRIDGVTDGRPASKAGLKPGDVVIQLGENKVLDMMSYMKALGKFNKGETTKVKILRSKEEMIFDITF